MSMPNIPDLNPEINIDREDAINLLIASVGMEELALAHILNAEGEKIQFILGTLEGREPPEDVTVCDILGINKSVNSTLKNVIKTEMLLQFKLEDAKDLIEISEDIETMTINGTKTWIDGDSSRRPSTINIYLLRDGVKIKTVILDSFGDGKFIFKNLPVWKTATEKYVYTLDEPDIDEYEKTIEGYNITNQHITVPK